MSVSAFLIRSGFLFACCSVCLVSPVHAFRPFSTDDAGTTPAATYELELCLDYTDETGTSGLALAHGITPFMDLGVSLGHCIHPFHPKSFENAEIGMKFSFIPDRLAASFSGSLGAPGYTANLLYSLPAGSCITIHANSGVATDETAGAARLTYSLASLFDYRRVQIGCETGGSNREIDWWQIAVLLSATDQTIMDVGIGGNFRENPDIMLTCGLFFAFGAKDGKGS